MLKQRPQGELIQADAFDHLSGLNITDSPFRLTDEQASAGYNYDYVVTGGFKKRFGHTQLNTTMDTQLSTMGMFVHITSFNTKTVLRAAGINLQTVNATLGTTTAVMTDTTTSTSSVFSSTQPVVFSQFNTTTINAAWLAGGGQSSGNLGGYTGTQYTLNGAAAPSVGTLSFTAASTDGTLPTGTYFYAIAFKKLATGAISNAALDLSVSVGSTQHVTVTFSGVTNPDSAKYTQVVIYRSAIAPTGVSGFTVGNIVATVNWSAGFYIDTGANQALADLVPRAGSTSLDNSVLPSGTYNVITTWKRHLVTASGSTLYFSDVNKPESWPTTNYITLPSGGSITALAVINFSTPTSTSIDEMLCIFKERELWIVTGNFFTTLTDTQGSVIQQADVALKFMDSVGCVAQPLLVLANGFIYWIDYRGIYIWDGAYKPVYISRPLEFDFTQDGDMDLTNLNLGIGSFIRKQNQVVWVVSSLTLGINKMMIKLDLRLTLPNMSNALAGRVLDGVFMKDSLTYNIYGMYSQIISASEVLYGSGNDGRIWKMYDNYNSDNGQAISFSYRTRPEDYGQIGTAKRFHKLLVWCRQSTTKNLTINYWTGYQITSDQKKTLPQQMVSPFVTTSAWDISTWDNAFWDTNYATYSPVVFNLNAVEGDALTLEFQQMDANAPLTIAGYSVIYSVAGLRK